MRIIFMGSPDFAVPTLKALNDHYNVVGVVTQPDRRAGRGRRLSSCAVKNAAIDIGLATFQPRRLRNAESVQKLATLRPELIIVAAYGQILPPSVLDLPKHGCINVHASLLPRWRGASPIHAAIRHGDPETGITIMKMDEGLDTGPILKQKSTPITEDITGGELSDILALLGAELLIDVLPDYLSGLLQPKPQQGEATYAPLLKKADGRLDFSKPAAALARQVRAYQPWPGTFFKLQQQRIAILAAQVAADDRAIPGRTAVIEGLPAVGTADGFLLCTVLQPAGKKPMPGHVFLNGARQFKGQSVDKDEPIS